MCLLYDRVLFAGDTIVTGEKFRLSPRPLTQDVNASKQSVRKLLNYDFEVAASGHGTPATDARSKLKRLVRTL